MFIEVRALKEPLRSSGAKYCLSGGTLRSYGALASFAMTSYRHSAALRPGRFCLRTLEADTRENNISKLKWKLS
jgi:hypothetical protein